MAWFVTVSAKGINIALFNCKSSERTGKQLIDKSITLDACPLRDIRVHAESRTFGRRRRDGVLLVGKDTAKVGHDHFSKGHVDVAVAGAVSARGAQRMRRTYAERKRPR